MTTTTKTTLLPSYTLYVPEASFRAFAILIAAEINGVDIAVETTKDALQTGMTLSKTGKLPVLAWNDEDDAKKKKQPPQETQPSQPCHTISTSASIARYISSIRTDTKLLGESLVERAEIDAWMDWCLTELELPATVWFYPAVQYMPFHENSYLKAKKDLAAALGVLEKALLLAASNTTIGSPDDIASHYYLVGSHLTLADVMIVSTLLYPFKLVCNDEYRAPFPKVVAWFQQCVQLNAFAQVVGVVPLCSEELKAK